MLINILHITELVLFHVINLVRVAIAHVVINKNIYVEKVSAICSIMARIIRQLSPPLL